MAEESAEATNASNNGAAENGDAGKTVEEVKPMVRIWIHPSTKVQKVVRGGW